MRGDWVGTPRRANPTADTHAEPAQLPCAIFVWAWAEDHQASWIGSTDPWQLGQV